MHALDKPVDPEDLETLRGLEESLWRADTRFNVELMQTVFAEDFFEFGRSGRIYARADLLFDSAEKREIPAALPLKDFRVRHLSNDIVQVTYVSEVKRDDSMERANRSSIWSRLSDSWVLRFHQGTPFQ